MPRRRQPTPPPPAPLEWVGGTFVVPGAITDEETPYHVEMALWCEIETGIALAFELTRAGSGETQAALARAYGKATESPLLGPPREPQRVRVATAAMAAALRPMIAPGIEVIVAETPEIEELAASLFSHVGESLAPDDAPDATAYNDFTTGDYFHGGLVSRAQVDELFRAARFLSALAPWNIAADEHVVRVDIPDLGIEGAAVSVLGQAGLSYGFLVLPDLAAFETMAESMESGVAERGRGFGTPMLALNLERIDDLPPGAAADIEEHAWQPANGRYPWVERRESDGSLVPVDATHMQSIIAIAETIGTFCMKAAEAFHSDGADAASLTIESDDRPSVRYTMPYEMYAAFGAKPGSSRRRPATAGRNDPCPCGSGRKYKHCHLRGDELQMKAPAATLVPVRAHADRPSGARGQNWTAVIDRVFAYAIDRFGAAFQRRAQDFHDPQGAEQIAMEWSLFHVRIRGRTPAEVFLSEAHADLPAEIRRFLAAQQRAWLSVWEVESVERGHGFTARDLLTGETRRIVDRKASETLTPRRAFLGRIVEWEGRSQLWGVYGQTLPPRATHHVIEAMRKRLRLGSAGHAPIDALRVDRTGRFLITLWEDAVEQIVHERRDPPRFTTRDGEDLVICSVTYAFDAGYRRDIAAALDRMSGVTPPTAEERSAGAWTYALARPERQPAKRPAARASKGPAKRPRARRAEPVLGEGIVGVLHLRAAQVVLETNSRERLAQLEARVREVIGTWVKETDRSETDAREDYLARVAQDDSGAKVRPVPLEAVPPPEILQQMQEFKRDYYRRWLDDSIPALGGKTPRQAARLARSRPQLDLLLREMEHTEAHAPEWERFDFAALRADLGL